MVRDKEDNLVETEGDEAPTAEDLLAENEWQELYNPDIKTLDFRNMR